MVVHPKKSWLTGVRARIGAAVSSHERPGAQTHLGILSFEVAKAMSRLISLHHSLTEPRLVELRTATMRSEGVAYLNSTDQLFLLRMACAEFVDELDQAVGSIARIGNRCRLAWPIPFDRIYSDIKSGASDEFVLGFLTGDLDRRIRKMEADVSATSTLHEEMETLAELEASERNLERWRNYSGPITPGSGAKPPATQQNPPGAELLMRRLGAQRQLVGKLKEQSLWGRSYDKVADHMSRTVVTLLATICSVFSLIVTDLPLVVFERNGRYRFAANRRNQNPQFSYFSGPLERRPAANAFVRNSGPILGPESRKKETRPWTERYLEPRAGTVGDSGLALRYADVVVLAEEMLLSPESAGKDARKELYRMLPSALRAAVKAKLRQSSRSGDGAMDDEMMAEGWKEAAGRILKWLGPMAHATVRWHMERSCERQRLEPAPKVLLLQTLQFADRVKAEAAIVEVLVGLCCVYRYQQGVLHLNLKESDSD